MGKFNSCFQDLVKYCKTNRASYAWIALHRCVEAYSKTTGETFNCIFKRYEEEFNFNRKIKDCWPTVNQMCEIGVRIRKEREEYLRLMNKLIQERLIEKRNGKRFSSNPVFIELTKKQKNHINPKRKAWYWRDIRKNNMEI